MADAVSPRRPDLASLTGPGIDPARLGRVPGPERAALRPLARNPGFGQFALVQIGQYAHIAA